MPFIIYNSLTQKKEIFTPLNPPVVKMYCCGPTVYDLLHIGNFRGAVFYNFLKSWLEYRGFKVTFVYNFTDVDDKILNRAKKENTSMQEVAQKYITEFKKDFQALKLKPHDHNPRATKYIDGMIQLIQNLLQNKKAYQVEQDIFYHVPAFPHYGKLSRKNIDELETGVRIEADSRKKDPRDFALWKHAASEDPGWDSPWGRGRPGWHIECTTMIHSLLGKSIDIHGGGSDLIFPHHENEIAQALGSSLSDKPADHHGESAPCNPQGFVKYWVHNNMFTFDGEKMAKSTGNQTIMRFFLESYHAEIFKYLVLSSHYRSQIEVSEKKIIQCVQALTRIYSFLKTVQFMNKNNDVHSREGEKDTSDLSQEIDKALDDDLNTPATLAILFTAIRRFNELKNQNKNKADLFATAQSLQKLIQKYGAMMSLFQEEPHAFLKQLDDIFLKKYQLQREEVDRLVTERTLARKNKNFKKADDIRKQLLQMNIEVKDTACGSEWETIKTVDNY